MMKIKPGKLFIISGPSGVGKGTILKEVLSKESNFHLAISVTTRAPRKNEVNGINYFFVSKKEFETKIENDELLEWCEFHDNYYGTLKSEVLNYIDNGVNVFLEIDTKGAKRIRENFSKVISVFIAPPTLEDLFKRLKLRNTEKKSDVQSRLAIAGKELAQMGEYDYVIINEQLALAALDLLHIVRRS